MTAGRPTDPRHVWVDGQLLPAEGPHLSVTDRGFQLGDGVFETLRARAGRVTELAEHLHRLRHSAEGLDIDLPGETEMSVTAGIDELLRVEGLAGPDGDASIRVTVSRGAYPGRGLLPSVAGIPPTIAIQAWPVTPPPVGHLETGLHVIASAIRRDPENPLVALKTTSRADYVHARLEARRGGADDAIFLTLDGYLSEATTANVFLVRGRAMDAAEEGAYVREVAVAKTAVLRMSLDAVERRNMPFVGETVAERAERG